MEGCRTKGHTHSHSVQTASSFPLELKAPCSVCTRLEVQSHSLKGEEEQVAFSFELGPRAPRISEGTAQSKQGAREVKSLLFKFRAGQEPGGEGPGTAAALEGY